MGAKVLPFVWRQASRAETVKSSLVANLWVARRERQREMDASGLIWCCPCGSQSFLWYRTFGLRCTECDRATTPPR